MVERAAKTLVAVITEVGVGFTVMVKVDGLLPHPEPMVIKLPVEYGFAPTFTVDTTVLVVVLIPVSVFEPSFDTYTMLPSGVTETP